MVNSDQGKSLLFEASPLCWGAENIPQFLLYPIDILANYNGATSLSSSGQGNNDLTGFPCGRSGRYFYSNMVNCVPLGFIDSQCATMFQCILNALSMKAAATRNDLFGCTPDLDLNPFRFSQLI